MCNKYSKGEVIKNMDEIPCLRCVRSNNEMLTNKAPC